MWFINTKAHGLSEHMIGQNKRHIVYQNKNMWSINNNSEVPDLIIYNYKLKVDHLSF